MYCKVNSLGIFGLEAFSVTVEADVSSGLPRFDLVGLPDAAVKESRERVRASIKNCNYDFPVGRVTVNIAPADLKKEGAVYDLPILMAILCATRQLKPDLSDYAFIGELSLDGEIRRVNGVLPMLLMAKEQHLEYVFVPLDNAAEASAAYGVNVLPVNHITQVVNHLNGTAQITPYSKPEDDFSNADCVEDFADVKGQSEAKRALEVAAAGGHNCMMIGPPGTGKSMLAKRLPSILPSMSFEEKIETTKIYSIAGALGQNQRLINVRPFRSPHHTVSAQGLTGGGASPKPGEISLSHNGVMFMDEFPEFDRRAKESLRQPIEDGVVTIARANGTVSYPSDIMLVAAMNPCPCGYYGHPARQCTCTDAVMKRYRDKISGPVLDRIDIHIEVQPVEYDQLSSTEKSEPSSLIKQRVDAARAIQQKRFEGTSVHCNAKMSPSMTREFCVLSSSASAMLKTGFEKLGLSARAYDKILRIARTIADLEQSDIITAAHIAEAIQYRSLDRKYWNR